MTITIDENNLKYGLLGIAIALVEIIRDALKVQAFRRMEGGTLTDDECERLGKAMMDIDMVLEEIKEEQGIAESVQAVRDGLDEIVNNVIDRIINPGKWPEEKHGTTPEETRKTEGIYHR